MFLKLEVAEERQTMVRCGGANKELVFPAATSAIGGGLRRDSPAGEKAKPWRALKRKGAYTDAAAGKPRVQIGTPHPDRLLPPLFDVG